MRLFKSFIVISYRYQAGSVVSLFELPCKNDTWYELPNFLLELFCTFMLDFSSRRNRHVVLFDAQHRLHILVHHSVSIYNYFDIIYCYHTNVQSYVSFDKFMSCIYMFTSESIRSSQIACIHQSY